MYMSSLFSGFNLEKIISSANSGVSLVNKAIPIYKQVSPVVKNVRSAFNSVKSVQSAAKEAAIKDIKSFERPITVFRKKSIDETRGKLNLDTLTFFK